ncbi:helicase with Zinc finger domain 2-like isoform x3, partial [Plakobranchus ocellatus]
MDERKNRLTRIEPYLGALRKFQEPKAINKASLLMLMRDLKDEGNTLFREAEFKEAGLFYSYALIVGRQLEQTFYHAVEREFLTILYCNASLCSARIGDYKVALKDAEAAMALQPKNIKAMYRRVIALDGLGRHQDALNQAMKGKTVDPKNNFDELVTVLRAKLTAQAPQAGVKKAASDPKDDKGDASSKGSEKTSRNGVLEKEKSFNSAAEKNKEQVKDMNSKKKKKIQSQKQQQQSSSVKIQQASAPLSDSGDSDSVDSYDDNEFAHSMSRIRGSASVLPPKGGVKPAASASTSSAAATSTASAKGKMGLDSFSVGKQSGRKETTKPVLYWPMESMDFRLACRICFMKEKEGIGGYTYRANYSHSCLHDVLIVRNRNNPNLNWLKIRPRFSTGPAYMSYKLCQQFQAGRPCRLGESNCTFAHSPAEISFWNLDRDGPFKISKFLKEAKEKGIFSSGLAYLTSSEPPAEKYIPGMTGVKPAAESHSNSNVLTSSQHGFGFQQQSPPFLQQQGPASTFVSENKPQFGQQFSVPPPARPPFKPEEPLVFKQPNQSSFSQMPINKTQQVPNTPSKPLLPHPSQTAPKVPNPFPELYCRLLCPACLIFTGQPWYYRHNPSFPHQCQQSILAYRLMDRFNFPVWVQIRERSSHRNFKGNYVMCHSVAIGNPDSCKFKENCTFAHNPLEQALWKKEQEGSYDIGEFVMSQKRITTFSGSQYSGNALSSSGMYVRDLLDKFGGYFRFICRDCFFAQRPMISGMDKNGMTCLGKERHSWQTARIIAHVKDTAYTPVDERKFIHEGAFYLMCNFQQFCANWYSNRCRYAHSAVEKAVWMLERDTKISRDELVQQSASLFTARQTLSEPPPMQAGGAQVPKVHLPQASQRQAQAQAKTPSNAPPMHVTEYCRTCWGKGQRSEEDKGKDRCVRGHSNFKLNSAFVSLPTVKEIRSLPTNFNAGMKLILCEYHPKCTRRVCNHPHGQEELEVWNWMLKNNVRTLREVCDRCREAQKEKTRSISKGESVINVASGPSQSKPLNQIIAPGDLHIHEHYCQYCGTSCNSDRQWDEHCMSERHINNVNSDKEHQWNFRQPPWGQGRNLDLCAKHLHNKSCQYSYLPEMYNMCSYAHSQEELDEWRERYEWRQMKRTVARDRNMFSYTESLLEEYHSQGDSINVISESVADVHIKCNEDPVLYRIDKNDIFTWTYEIYSKRTLEKVALLHNKDRLHFKLLSTAGGHHQMAPGDKFLEVDSRGKRCYKVNVHFNGGMFGSFSQWVVFDFGSKPVLVKKLSVEIGDQLQHERVQDLREELTFDRWTSQNRAIVRFSSELNPDRFTEGLLFRYKEPSASVDVVTSDRLADLNQHNYVHKMHGLLELEEITRQAIIASYNLSCEVTLSKTLQESGMFLIGTNGDLFVKVNLEEHLTQDTLSGKLVLSCVGTALIARAGSTSKQVYEVSIVGENNYGYDGRGKEYIYLVIDAETARALAVSPGQTVRLELQFQMDRRFFCRMHYALDSLRSIDVVFPDVMKFKPDINAVNALSKIRSNVLNEDQMTAVRHIVVQREGYTPPFVMYGPFGTGKTETLAQATMTLLRERKDNCRILICTQSNSAADLYITKHLHAFVTKGRNVNVLRLNAKERRINSVPQEVFGFCHCLDKKTFKIPSKEEISNYHLVLTTVETSIVLSELDMHGCFSHIFVDEAGQTLECEILMPLSLATPKTCVVLTGDHHQISPHVYSQEASRQNFGVSMLVRLFNYYDDIANCGVNIVSDQCQKSPLNIFLSINYRTKNEILRFISSVFYGGPDSLKAYGKIPAVMGITPLMFYAVQGRESQNPDSVSYLNHAEAQEVVGRVAELLDNWPAEWGPKDPKQVAVISTYSDQVKHIRKLLRKDRTRPDLSEVDVGPIHSFQGKEVRALFITAVRTSNLLREPHIIHALEAHEDIGDLGFMSDPRLLNTALTRTQSFVAVVGDPTALCLIGECTQIWRTYLKHCSNMGSVRPMSYTYDAVKNMSQQIFSGPENKVIEMISRRGQESFKHLLNNRKAAKSAAPESGREEMENIEIGNVEEGSGAMVQELTNVPTSSGDNHVSLYQEDLLLSETKKFYIEERDEVSTNTETISEDILFQLAKESQGQSFQNEDVKSERISITLEEDGLAVLTYSQGDSSRMQNREPFKIVSEEDSFVAFTVHDEDTGKKEHYDNWAEDELCHKLDTEPDRFFKCMLNVKNRDFAVATLLGPHTIHTMQIGSKDIQINGPLNRGHAFDGDTVVVELLKHTEENILLGRVKGILDHAQDPSSRLCVCTTESENPGILTPLNSAMPRIYTIISTPHVALAMKGCVCVYNFGSRNCIEFSNYEKIDRIKPHKILFIVRYLCWQPGFFLPFGIVVGVIKQNKSLERGLKVIDVEYNVQHDLQLQAEKESESLFPADSIVPTDLLKNRRDLTQSFCFSVEDSSTKDKELAISIMQIGNFYEVGLHVTDVAAFIDKDSVLDQECELRGASLFPLSREPQHMLPSRAATDMCSLLPGLDRLALSIVIKVDEEGKPCEAPEVFHSVINNKRSFSHAEVEDILFSPEEAEGDYLKSCVIVLYQLAFLWRGQRLGNSQFFSGLSLEKRLTQHSHLIMNEVKLQFNGIVANLLLKVFPETTPLLIQPAPQKEKLEMWKYQNAMFAIHSIPMTKAFLENKVCHCTTACTCVFSYMRQNRLENVEHLAMLKDSWLMICQAVSEEYQDFDLAQELIASPEHMPQIWLSTLRLAQIQQAQTYICSDHLPNPNDRVHYGLSVSAYTNFTSPLRNFISIVLQRMLTAFIDGAASPYNTAEMGDLCAAATATDRETTSFHKDVFLLHLSSAIQARPLVVNAVIEGVDALNLRLNLGPGLTEVPSQSLDLHLLSPMNISCTQTGLVQLDWQERVYEYPGCKSQAQYRSGLKLDPDRLVCNIPFISWQRLLIAIREKNEAKLAASVQEISHQVGNEMELQSKSQPEVLSDQVRHFVPFSLMLQEGQSLSVQVSARLCQGRLNPCVQLLQLTPCLAICLEHKREPEECFTFAGSPCQPQVTYTDELQYTSNWLLPALALETARQAVENGEHVTIHNVNIVWSVTDNARLSGLFSLTREFCECSAFNPNAGNIIASTLLNGNLPYCEDDNFCLDYICVRYSGLPATEEPGLDESVAAVVNNSQPITWVGHCLVKEVTETAQGFLVKIALVQSSMKIPELLLRQGGTSSPCTLEWICKTKDYRIIDTAARGLAHAQPFVKDIITGKKPLNT